MNVVLSSAGAGLFLKA